MKNSRHEVEYIRNRRTYTPDRAPYGFVVRKGEVLVESKTENADSAICPPQAFDSYWKFNPTPCSGIQAAIYDLCRAETTKFPMNRLLSNHEILYIAPRKTKHFGEYTVSSQLEWAAHEREWKQMPNVEVKGKHRRTDFLIKYTTWHRDENKRINLKWCSVE